MASIPGPEALEAFRLSGVPVPLPGGEGCSVRVGDAVLKPVDDQEFTDWLAETMSHTGQPTSCDFEECLALRPLDHFSFRPRYGT